MSAEPSQIEKIGRVVSAIEAGKAPSVLFLYGEEEFLITEARERITEALKRRLGEAAELVEVPGGVEDLRAILSELLSSSLFSSNKVVLVRDFTAVAGKGASKKKEVLDFAGRLGAGLPKGKFCVLSVCESGTPVAAFAKSLKNAVVLNFPKIKSFPGMQVQRDPLFAFVGEFLTRSGKTITSDAFLALKDSVGTDLRTICSELEKLCLFVGEKNRIDAKDVDAIVSAARQRASFELADAVARKNVGQAFETLANLLRENTPPLFIVQSLASQFRYLLQARVLLSRHLDEAQVSAMSFFRFRDGMMKELVGLVPMFGSGPTNLLTRNPFVIHKSLQMATKFSHKELAAALVKVSETDAAIKRSLAPASQLVRSLVLDLAAPSS
ncbi:MAG TPA: DNA polymerase III subunit delta [bacterium]|nr:DNA polymerase III subunit delta [bacterium]